MDFVWAVVYPLQGKRWYLRLPLLTAVVLIPIVGILIGLDYIVRSIRRIADGNYEPPGLTFELSEHGLYILGSAIAHFLAWGVIAIPVEEILTRLKALDVIEGHVLGLLMVPIALHFFMGGIRYVLFNVPRAMFDVRRNARLIWRNKWAMTQSIIHAMLYIAATAGVIWGSVLVLYLMGMPDFEENEGTILHFAIFMVVLVITFIGMPVCGSGYLLGQLARRMDLGDEKAKRKNDALKHA